MWAAIRAASRSAGSRRGAPAQQQRGAAAAADCFGDGLDRLFVGRPGLARRRQCCGLTALAPGDVGRQNQGCDLAGRTDGRADGADRVAAQVFGLLRAVHEVRRDVARHGLDIGLQLRIQRLVPGGVIADDVDHRHLALARVVKIGQPVAQAAAQMQQRRGRLVGHARVAVGSTGGDALEQREYGAHARLVVERGDKVHFTGAGVGEADLDTGIGQGLHQGLGAVGHGDFPSRNFFYRR